VFTYVGRSDGSEVKTGHEVTPSDVVCTDLNNNPLTGSNVIIRHENRRRCPSFVTEYGGFAVNKLS
jgi:hypothetical protein